MFCSKGEAWSHPLPSTRPTTVLMIVPRDPPSLSRSSIIIPPPSSPSPKTMTITMRHSPVAPPAPPSKPRCHPRPPWLGWVAAAAGGGGECGDLWGVRWWCVNTYGWRIDDERVRVRHDDEIAGVGGSIVYLTSHPKHDDSHSAASTHKRVHSDHHQ